jgi:hypothetical protein
MKSKNFITKMQNLTKIESGFSLAQKIFSGQVQNIHQEDSILAR